MIAGNMFALDHQQAQLADWQIITFVLQLHDDNPDSSGLALALAQAEEAKEIGGLC